ncbi:hypothetical protein EI555_003588, partial [Monodon monoceros]
PSKQLLDIVYLLESLTVIDEDCGLSHSNARLLEGRKKKAVVEKKGEVLLKWDVDGIKINEQTKETKKQTYEYTYTATIKDKVTDSCLTIWEKSGLGIGKLILCVGAKPTAHKLNRVDKKYCDTSTFYEYNTAEDITSSPKQQRNSLSGSLAEQTGRAWEVLRMCGIFSRENRGRSRVISTDPEETGKGGRGLQKRPQMSRNFTVNGLLQLPRLLRLNPRPQTQSHVKIMYLKSKQEGQYE